MYFEKENIWTFDGRGELLLTIMSSLAQEESRSISENCTWGQKKRFADDKVTVPFTRFLGYDRGPDGNLVVNKEQAAIVQCIYAMFLQGMTYNGIAQKLTADGILSPGGKPKWNTSSVKSILSNEKYKGCALLLKTYNVDYLTKKKKVNEGEIPQCYVEDNHCVQMWTLLHIALGSEFMKIHASGHISDERFAHQSKTASSSSWMQPWMRRRTF